MKNLILLMSVMAISTSLLAQQPCVPGTLTGVGSGYIVPDSATGLATICESGGYYEQIIYMKAPKDTTFDFNGITIVADVDSFVLDSTILGLPSYLSVEAVPAFKAATSDIPYTHLVIRGDSLACLKISGTVPPSTPMSYPLTMSIKAFLTEPVFQVSIDTAMNYTGFSFKVDSANGVDCFPDAVVEPSDVSFKVSAFPNPVLNRVRIQIVSATNFEGQIEVVDLMGRSVLSKNRMISSGSSEFDVDLTQIPSGFYTMSISGTAGRRTIQLIKY